MDAYKSATRAANTRSRGEFDRPASPTEVPDMGAAQIDGLEALSADRYMSGRGQSFSDGHTLETLRFPEAGPPSEAHLALSAMQYLPYPLLVLNDQKTVVMANDAMGRLLGLDEQDIEGPDEQGLCGVDRLQHQTLSQLGIDMLQDGRPVWVTWESLYA